MNNWWYYSIERWYLSGWWTAENVNNAVKKGWISADDAHKILDEKAIVPADSDLGEAIIEEVTKPRKSKKATT